MENSKDKCTTCEDRNLYTDILADWLIGVIQKKSRYEFFSIVELDERLEDPKHWLHASFCIYDCLLSLLEEEETYLESYLCIPLLLSSHATKLEDITFSYLKKEISTTEAPMVFLRPDVNNNKGVFVEKLSLEIGKRVYLGEMLNRKGNYDRGIYILKG